MGQIKNIKLHIVTDIKLQTNMAPYHKWSGSPILWKIRDLLVGKRLIVHNRYVQEQATRSVPAPRVTPGIHHKLSDNYYGLSQDGRHAHQPPTAVATTVPQLAEGEASEAATKPKLF